MVGVLRHCAGPVRLRGRPWQHCSRAPEYSKRVPHRPADRPVGDDRLCPDDKLSTPAHGTALGHRRQEADVHSRVHDLPRIRPAVHGRGQRRHTDRLACADGTWRFDDAGDGNGDSPFSIPRERTWQGARSSDKRGRCRRGRRAGHRRLCRRRLWMARRVHAHDNARCSRHRRRSGGAQPEKNGRAYIRRSVRPRRRYHVHGNTDRVPACHEQRSRDGLARSADRCRVHCSRRTCGFLYVLGAAKPESDARRVTVSTPGLRHRSRGERDLVHEHLVGAILDALLPASCPGLLACSCWDWSWCPPHLP